MSESWALGPQSESARFVLRRDQAEANSVSYRAEISVRGAKWQGRLSLGLSDGAVVFDAWQFVEPGSPAEPPQWVLDQMRAALRSAFRGLQKQGEVRVVDLPRRITRWRAAPTPKP